MMTLAGLVLLLFPLASSVAAAEVLDLDSVQFVDVSPMMRGGGGAGLDEYDYESQHHRRMSYFYWSNLLCEYPTSDGSNTEKSLMQDNALTSSLCCFLH